LGRFGGDEIISCKRRRRPFVGRTLHALSRVAGKRASRHGLWFDIF
jgi:hypothetical protein